MICRIWYGRTSEANADSYERLLRGKIVLDILRRRMSGFHGIDILTRSVPEGTEFVTVMWFDSIEAVQRFAGPDYERAVVPAAARQLLTCFESQSAHDAVVERRSTYQRDDLSHPAEIVFRMREPVDFRPSRRLSRECTR